MHRGSLVPSGKRTRFWKFMIGYRQPGPNQVGFLRAVLLDTAEFQCLSVPWVGCHPASPALPGRSWRQQTFPGASRMGSIQTSPVPPISLLAEQRYKQTHHDATISGLATTIETDFLRARHRLRCCHSFAFPVASSEQFSVRGQSQERRNKPSHARHPQ